jgi:DNA helicase II / ATP-dependent DNA helicase PcrA
VDFLVLLSILLNNGRIVVEIIKTMPKYKLNPAQKQAIEHTKGPLLIVAGAGTGKTTVITKKISYLIEKNFAKPEEILALTFTDKAAGEMEERVDEMLETGYVDLQISTFHAFCQRLLEEYGVEIGLPKNFKLLSQTDAWLMMKESIYDFNLDYYRPMGNPTGQIHTLLDHFSKCKDELISTQEYLDHVEGIILDKDEAEIQEKNRLIEVADAYHKYEQILLDSNAMDFGGLIFYTVKLLRERPNILQKLQERFKYILVDEFQDVNWAQYELVKLLTGKETSLTAVGDDDQSIYSFRGSNVSIIMRFKEDFKNADEIVLTENYRSAKEVLDFAYKSIQHNNPDRLEKKLKIDKKLKAKGGIKDGGVEHLHFESLDDEVQGVVKKISEIKEQDKDATLDDFALLVRANSHVEPFLNAFEAYNIPYEYLASSGLYRQPVVLDSVNFLNIVENIHNDKAIYRLLRMPFLNFKEDDLQKLTSGSKKKSIPYYEACKRAREFFISPVGIEICQKLIDLVHDGMKRARFEKPTAVLYNFLEDSGYLKYLAHEETVGNREVIRQIYHVKQFFNLIEKYEQAIPGAHVAGFVDHYNQIIESGDNGKMVQIEDTPDSVNIITVHSAKGLEYKYVFVVNCVEERLPTRKKSSGIEIPSELIKENLPEGDFHYQEERRLFYVACTRAKQKLFLTSAEDYGGMRKKKLSRFLVELELGTTIDNKEKTSKKIILNKKTSEKKDKAELVYEPPKKFSFSQINAYNRCPYQYKLSHVLKIPMKGSPSFSFGNTIHNTLQKFYERVQELNNVKQDSLFGLPAEKGHDISGGVKVPKIEELLEMYEEKWIADWYNSKKQRKQYFEKGKEILKIFYTSQEGNWTVPVSLEGFFKIKVGEYLINGRIDRIDQLEDGSLEIIDYKTGKGKEKLSADDKQQLLIYQIAAQSLPEYKNIGEVSQLTFYYVNDDLRQSFIGKDKDIEKLQEKLLDTMNKISEGEFKPTPGPFICKYCEYKEICEFRKL